MKYHNRKKIAACGLRGDNFVIPYGYNKDIVPEVHLATQQYYRSYREAGEQVDSLPVVEPYALTSYSVSFSTPNSDIQEWINQAAKKKGWLILVLHQIDDDKLTYHVGINKFKQIIDMIMQSGLPVVLPSQALNVVKNKS